jgi:hypothetical protein
MFDKNRKIPENSGLTPTQEKLIDALLQYPTIKAAADSVGIHERTARNYLHEPAFSSAYALAKQEMTAEIRGSLVALARKSIEGLQQTMDDPECPYAVRMKAYQLALDRVIPISAPQPEPEQEKELIPLDLLQYMSSEQIAMIERIFNEASTLRDEKLAEG